MITTNRGIGSASRMRAVLGEVLRPRGSQHPLATAEFGVEADEGPLLPARRRGRSRGPPCAAVGRTNRTSNLPCSRSARSSDRVGLDPAGHAHHERPQQLALARSGRSGDQRVRAVRDEVDLDDSLGGHADRGPQRRVRPGAGSTVDDVVGFPTGSPPCRARRGSAGPAGGPGQRSADAPDRRAARVPGPPARRSVRPSPAIATVSAAPDPPLHSAPPSDDTVNVRRHTVGTEVAPIDGHHGRRARLGHEPAQRAGAHGEQRRVVDHQQRRDAGRRPSTLGIGLAQPVDVARSEHGDRICARAAASRTHPHSPAIADHHDAQVGRPDPRADLHEHRPHRARGPARSRRGRRWPWPARAGSARPHRPAATHRRTTASTSVRPTRSPARGGSTRYAPRPMTTSIAPTGRSGAAPESTSRRFHTSARSPLQFGEHLHDLDVAGR